MFFLSYLATNLHKKTLVHKLVDHKLVYHLHFLGFRGCLG